MLSSSARAACVNGETKQMSDAQIQRRWSMCSNTTVRNSHNSAQEMVQPFGLKQPGKSRLLSAFPQAHTA